MSESIGVRRRTGFLAVAVASLALGGAAGFHAVRTGIVEVPSLFAGYGAEAHGELDAWTAPSFVLLSPITVSLGPEARARHLRVALQLEVAPGAERAVADVAPRVLDVLNTFLRAVDEREFEIPRAMARLRAQMLRRVQLVAPPGTVHDVLIQEFVLN